MAWMRAQLCICAALGAQPEAAQPDELHDQEMMIGRTKEANEEIDGTSVRKPLT